MNDNYYGLGFIILILYSYSCLNITFQNNFQVDLKSTLFRFRFILNIHELVVIGNAIKCMEQGQNGFPIWSLYMISISHLMLSLNSSTNIFIYFFLSSRFRQDCKRRYSRMKNTIRHEWQFKFFWAHLCSGIYYIFRMVFVNM